MIYACRMQSSNSVPRIMILIIQYGSTKSKQIWNARTTIIGIFSILFLSFAPELLKNRDGGPSRRRKEVWSYLLNRFLKK